VVCGASAKGRSSLRRLNHVLRKLTGLALRYEIKVELIWTPTWANSGDPPSRGADLEEMLADLPRRLEEWSASRLQEQSELEEEAGREGSYSEGGRAESLRVVRPLALGERLPLQFVADDVQGGLCTSGNGAALLRLEQPPGLQPPRPQPTPPPRGARREREVELPLPPGQPARRPAVW
jgi:hypothetical protein